VNRLDGSNITVIGARSGGYKARGIKATGPLGLNMRGLVEDVLPEADHIPSKVV
jgi:hypothetical protein